MEELVLYVAKDKTNAQDYCRGSKMCLKVIDVLPPNTVNIQDCDKLRAKGVTLPSWLNGTPILVSKDSGDIYKGGVALKYLREVLEEYSERRKLEVESEENKENNTNTSSQFGYDDDTKENDEEQYDPWDDDFSKVDQLASEKPKATQQDVDEFMRRRNESMQQPDMNGSIPSIPQEQS